LIFAIEVAVARDDEDDTRVEDRTSEGVPWNATEVAGEAVMTHESSLSSRAWRRDFRCDPADHRSASDRRAKVSVERGALLGDLERWQAASRTPAPCWFVARVTARADQPQQPRSWWRFSKQHSAPARCVRFARLRRSRWMRLSLCSWRS